MHQDLVAAGFVVLDFSHRGMKWASDGFDRAQPRPLLSRDVEDPERYVYRDIYLDCLLALRFLRGLPDVDPDRVGILGTSQGGGLTIGTAALGGARAAAADLPWLTHFAQQLAQPVLGPYNEVKDLLRARPDLEAPVRRTLAYHDTTSLATRLQAPTLVSLGQADAACPPESVRVLFERIPACKLLLEVPGLGHARSMLWRRMALSWMQTWL
jgi:cephalosporin-C deacetylase